jgi:hypothetical protein
MKGFIVVLSLTILGFVVTSSFSTSAYANASKMSGYDRTYKSTGKCVAGVCAPRRHPSTKLRY